MTQSYTMNDEAGDLFCEADEKYDALKERLTSAEVTSATHSEVEKLLDTEGREVLRVLYQSHLAVRSEAYPEGIVTGDDGVTRTHQRDGTGRQLTSIFGPVEVVRTAYTQRGSDSRFPLDAALNLPDDKYSFEVHRRTAVGAAQNSFDNTVETLADTTGAHVPKRQVEELVVKAARDFEAFYEDTVLDVPPEETGDLLVLTFDMKGIVMHQVDLRPATRRAAERKVYKLDKRLTKGEKRDRKRMAMVSAVYTLQPWVRTPEDIVRALGPVRDATAQVGRPSPEYKRVWASVAKNSDAVIRQAFEEALSRDPERAKTWVTLVDGDPHQLKRVAAIGKEFGVEVMIVLDVIHMTEYLWKAAHAFHKDGTRKAQQWVSERLLRVLQGRASTVAGGMRRSATRRNLSGTKRKAVDRCANYMLKHKQFMRYDLFLALGLPIGTGVIEGACRHLVRDRMDITGARWRLERAEAILKLRALRSSGDFEQYWKFHEDKEAERNHHSRYTGGRAPEMRQPGNSPVLTVVR
jgi:hypothetical protein